MPITEFVDLFVKKTKAVFSDPAFQTPPAAGRRHGRRILHALYQPYKWLVFVPFLVLSTLGLFPIALLIAAAFGPEACSRTIPPLWSRLNGWMTPITVTVHHRARPAPGQSYVVVSNHQSHYDIFILYGWLGLDFKWVMKAELGKVPVIGYLCRKMNHIFIDRSDPRGAVHTINRAVEGIGAGTSVIFFPEGTRSATGQLGPFKKGAFRLARDCGLPILPVTILGTRRILPKGTLDLLPGKVDLVVHPPIPIQKDSAPRPLESLMEEARQKVASVLPRR